MIFKPKETNTMCLSTKLNLADKTIGKWLTVNELDGIKWEPSDQLKKLIKKACMILGLPFCVFISVYL